MDRQIYVADMSDTSVPERAPDPARGGEAGVLTCNGIICRLEASS